VSTDSLPPSRSSRAARVIGLCAALLVGASVHATEPTTSSRSGAAYDELQEWRFTQESFPIPEGGIEFALDSAGWVLESGRLWVQKPLPDGTVTGLVFEGEGRFELGVPDPFELAQLQRFAEEPELERI
jgi:hypothetical protein